MNTALDSLRWKPLLALAVLLAPALAPAASITLAATDDALVNSTKPSTVYGLTHYLSVYYDGVAYNRSYLKFDLSALPGNAVVTAATLSLYAFTSNGYALPMVAVHHVGDDSWSEATIDWSNRPSYDLPTLAGSMPVVNAWQDFDLLAGGVWNAAADVADGAISLLLIEGEPLSSTVKQVWYSPGEQQSYYVYEPPRLALQYQLVPEPSTLSLAALTLGMLGLSRRAAASEVRRPARRSDA